MSMSAPVLAPPALEAGIPPEAEGRSRDDVRLLVAWRSSGRLRHARFRDLPSFLAAGDLVVVNTSGTVPAALDAMAGDGTPLVVHFSTELSPGRWVVEPRRMAGPAGVGTERWTGDLPSGRRWALGGGGFLTLVSPYRGSGRLWLADVDTDRPVVDHLAAFGRPIRYSYATHPWPLTLYQTVYATEPGSAEMPSAGRPFTPELITRLVASGVAVTPVVLHTGVASLEGDEEPYPEWFRVPAVTAARVNAVRAGGGRVVAVGTTVVRALESAVVEGGGVAATAEGWTDLVVGPERGVQIVDGLLTGWHDPAGTHLRLLEAIAGGELLRRSYSAAASAGYRGHEFGDVHLILP
jgi:S-adenosylmethionine:tRNA ribosyltransferase-isomerase